MPDIQLRKEKTSKGFLIRTNANLVVKSFIGNDIEKLEHEADKFIESGNTDSIFRFDANDIVDTQEKAGEILFRTDNVKINLDEHSFLPGTGFLKVDVISTRTGIFDYSDGRGGVRKELRRAEDILKPASLNTMMNVPFTIHHPDDMVNVDNVKKVIEGFTGGSLDIVDLKNKEVGVKQPVVIFGKNAINDVLSGKIPELSYGYTLNHLSQSGKDQNNDDFDVIQINHIHNHLSGVEAARAGSEAKFLLDCKKTFKIFVKSVKINNNNDGNNKHGGNKMPKIHINGINLEVSDDVASAYKAEKTTLDTEVNQLKTDKETLVSEKATLRAEKDNALDITKDNDKKIIDGIKVGVDEKLDLLVRVKSLFTDDQFKNVRKMDSLEIMKSVLELKKIDYKADDEKAYIKGRFDGVMDSIETEPKKDETTEPSKAKVDDTSPEFQKLKDSLKTNPKHTPETNTGGEPNGKPDYMDDVVKGLDAEDKKLQEAYLTPVK